MVSWVHNLEEDTFMCPRCSLFACTPLVADCIQQLMCLGGIGRRQQANANVQARLLREWRIGTGRHGAVGAG